MSNPVSRLWLGVTGLVSMLVLTGCAELHHVSGGRGICGTIILILDIIAIIEVAGSKRSIVGKVLWILLILMFPLGGVLIYFLVAR